MGARNTYVYDPAHRAGLVIVRLQSQLRRDVRWRDSEANISMKLQMESAVLVPLRRVECESPLVIPLHHNFGIRP